MKCKKAATIVAGLMIAVGAAAPAVADAEAKGVAIGSPGFLSGNLHQSPLHHQHNLCGNSTNATTSLLNPAFGHVCFND
ncbi:chaplin [Streptomyces sp. NPDC058220]|uniref:chaplin n=1 Tax=unclassified Streptomyces TaxID=2593676 RepID=UPI00365E70D7